MLSPSKPEKLKNGKELLLRSPVPEEAAALLEHLAHVFRESYRNLNTPPEVIAQITLEQERGILTSFAQADDRFMLSAFDGTTIVGNLGITVLGKGFANRSASLGMSILKEFQGQGLGAALIRYALIEAKRIGLHRVDLHVRTYNQAGIALYEKMGFRRIGVAKEIAFIDGKYEDEFIYEIIL